MGVRTLPKGRKAGVQLRRGDCGQATEGTGQQRGQDSGKIDTNHFSENKLTAFTRRSEGTEGRSPGSTGDTQGSHNKKRSRYSGKVTGAGKPLGLEKMCRQRFQVQNC